MNNKHSLVLVSLAVAVALVGAWVISKRQSQPAEPDAASSPSPSAQVEGQRAGLDGVTVPSADSGKKPQVISGLTPREGQGTGAPADGEYFFDLTAPHAGQMVIATVTLGERSHKLSPNEVGDFQRVTVGPRQTIPVRVEYPEGRPGQAVVVQVMDGGTMVAPGRPEGIDHDMVRLLKLDERKCAEMAFRVTDNGGMHRVVLTNGADRKVLDFWVQN